MTESTIVKQDLRPAYYDDFHCLAAGCRLSCCIGWSISFNKRDYLSLKRQNGSTDLTTRLEHGLCRLRKGPLSEIHYGAFTMAGGRCALLRDDCLCALQLEKGPNALPFVCRKFPRSETYTSSGYLERSLTPACESVLALLWNLPDGLEFYSDPLPKERWREIKFPELFSRFQEIRSDCIDLLQDRQYPLPQRILRMGIALKEFQKSGLIHWKPLLVQMEPLKLKGMDTVAMFLSHILRILLSLKIANPEFSDITNDLVQALSVRIKSGTTRITVPTAPYLATCTRFQEVFEDRDYFMENLMVTLFFHLQLPNLTSPEELWKSYVNFCNLYSIYRFLSVMSCREGISNHQDEWFRLMVFASRGLLHNNAQQVKLRDEFFQNDSATLAHMAILLSG